MSIEWYRLPRPLGLFRLFRLRERMRRDNLANTEPDLGRRPPHGANTMGAAGTRFGRNVPLEHAYPDEESLLSPNPRVVSDRLLARERFQPATILNLLAAAWIQFQVHDWFSHGTNEPDRPFEVDVADDEWPGERPMQIRRTRVDPTREDHLPPTFRNRETHWWDGSQVYGSTREREEKIRSRVDGKLRIESNGFLPLDAGKKGIDLTGVNGNWWVGLTLLHTLFAREHNEICDVLKAEHSTWSDQRLFDHARLINAALMAKIHTIDWTPAIVPHRTATSGVRANWWGLLGEFLKLRRRRHGSLASRIDLLTGVPGSLPEQHAAPYSLTEEFVAVYRMHPLIPDIFEFHTLDGDTELKRTLDDVAGDSTRDIFGSLSMAEVFYSFGISYPGALTLRNFPNSLRRNVRLDGRTIDLAAIDVLRDRERGVPRYNDFRELLYKPRLKSFEELTDDPELVRVLREVYDNNIDQVDTMVGMYAEPLPPGFGFSETAFRIFLLMASRRLKSDRFYTIDYRPEIYTQTGIDWVENNNMTTVLLRHFPELEPALRNVDNPFRPWNIL